MTEKLDLRSNASRNTPTKQGGPRRTRTLDEHWLQIRKRRKTLLESKEDMRRRGVPSPDEGDAIALCFIEARFSSPPEGSPSVELWPSSIQFKEMTAELPELGVLVSRLASLRRPRWFGENSSVLHPMLLSTYFRTFCRGAALMNYFRGFPAPAGG
jgi:hypothetical protein